MLANPFKEKQDKDCSVWNSADRYTSVKNAAHRGFLASNDSSYVDGIKLFVDDVYAQI